MDQKVYAEKSNHTPQGNMFSKLSLFLISCLCLQSSSAQSDLITAAKVLRDSETLLSSNGIFKLGFFSPINSTYRYVGIWYNNKNDSYGHQIVWLANRDNPLKDSSGMLKVSADGNLQLLDGKNNMYWSSNTSSKQNDTVAQLLGTGNLVLYTNVGDLTSIWQSFDHPCHLLLTQDKLTIRADMKDNPTLRSWKSSLDPSSGQFTTGLIPSSLPEIVTLDGKNRLLWRSGPWTGNIFLGIHSKYSSVVSGAFSITNDQEGTFYLSYSVSNQSLLYHFMSNYDGRLLHKLWDDGNQKWEIIWQSISSDCDVYAKCGPFASCNEKESPICSCLKGFEPKNIEEWSKGNKTSGCVRRTPLRCVTPGGKEDGFLRLKNVKVPAKAQWSAARNQDDCGKWCLGNCSCLAYAYSAGIGCMLWTESLIDIQQLPLDGSDLFLRLAHSELGETSIWRIVIPVVAVVVAVVVVLSTYYLWRWKAQGNGLKNIGSPFNQLDCEDLPIFKFQSMGLATNNFSETNKLGQGGFGSLYKGELEDGQHIAVKRLSKASGQGLQEFMNEVVVISKLQHKNLVRLLGCCVEGDEKILVYEYMPNNSLDSLLFNAEQRLLLDWKKRFDIIKGICRGLLYLHRDSRLKIIHRDLKASNILLDEDLNPKISDFGMARIFGTKQDQANTLRVVGTYGYMSPEYAMEGVFSEKSDVYSFGILLLEIVSGKTNKILMELESMSLLTYVWQLWNENNTRSLIDPTVVVDPCLQEEILKCIHLGLLCVQEFPEDRPSIAALISMLDIKGVTDFPQPKPPGFTQRKVCSTDGGSQNGLESVNLVSLTVISGR